MKMVLTKIDDFDRKTLITATGFILSIAVWLLLSVHNISWLSLIRYFSVIVFGYASMVTDLSTKRIPNKLILTMIALWGFIMFTLLFIELNVAVEYLFDSLLGFAIGGGLFLIVYMISKKGLGGGDVKFMAAAGLYLGFESTIPVILYGTVLASIVGLTLILLKKIGRKDSLPLAPFLFIGIMITAILKGQGL